MSSSSRRNDSKMFEIYEKFRASCDFTKVGKVLGKGAFGEVRDIVYKNKTMAGKLIKRENEDEQSEEEKYGVELRGQNIIKINKVYTKKIDGNNYDLIIMEKAILRDLGKLNEFYHNHNLLKLIYFPFDELSGDCLLRFYARQIVNALETLNRNYFIHYDMKPENLLIAGNLIVKLSDFSLLTKVKSGTTKIPGGTPGYLTPEYYIDRNVDSEDARKQDYFALGSTLFFLKYGEQFLKFKKSDSNIMNNFFILDIIQKQLYKIKSQKLSDKDFIEFLSSLISYQPKDRPSFEQIYRNKWLNKDVEYVNSIFAAYENDEEKLIMELQKKDFLIKKEKERDNELFGYESLDEKGKELKNDLIDEKKKKEIEKKRYRFRFKKKKIDKI